MLSKLFARNNARDPVCGRSVPKDGAPTSQFVGETYHFCSERCRDRFQAVPARYLEISIKLPDSSSNAGGCC